VEYKDTNIRTKYAEKTENQSDEGIAINVNGRRIFY
jgi:hypothetical protein